MPPEYWREYRRTHPAYAAAERRAAAVRRQKPAARAQRKAYERAHYRSKAQPVYAPPDLSTEPVWRLARELLGPQRTTLTTLYDPLWEDMMSVAMLALLEGNEPAAALAAAEEYRRVEQGWARMTADLLLFN